MNNDEHQLFDLEREPLDRPPPTGIDWGGDGTDLSRPVRAHVLAALRPNSGPYPPPVDQLPRLGDPRNAGVEERQRALGFRQEHLPDLLRMARDRDLYTSDGDTDEVWGPLHALHALFDLDVSASVSELLPLFDLEDDWFSTLLPELIGQVGEPALEPLRAYMADRTRWAFGHGFASEALEKLAVQHSNLRDQVVEILTQVLRDAKHYHEVANTEAMSALVDLGAVEGLPLIRRAFELGQIDEMVRGPWGEVLKDLGVEPEEGDPLVAESQRRFEERHEQMFPREMRERFLALSQEPRPEPPPRPAAQPARPTSRTAAQERARKQKNKRKIESASRKANRKRR
jgi:hypothetical protein